LYYLIYSNSCISQTEIALKKARMAYDISNKKNRPAGKNYYACLIYKL
jgi:hypothetical protein